MEFINKNVPKALISTRQNLGLLAPLDTPFVIEMGICSYCNLKCKFCFHYNQNFTKEIMKMDLFKKIINDLKEFPNQLKKLKICGYGENLIHPQFVDMLKYVVQSEVTEFVELTTNGILLTQKLCEAIVDAGLNQINISIEAVTSEDYFSITGQKVDVDKLVSTISYLYEYKQKTNASLIIYVKIIDKSLKNKEDEQLFYSLFEKSCDYLFVENMIDIWLDPDNSTVSNVTEQKNVYGLPLKNNVVCPFLFTRLIIHADGTVVPCCSDWNKKCVLGNLNEESVKKVWNGVRLHEMRMAHLHHRKNDEPLCVNCSVYDLNSADNIDGYEAEILSRMIKQA